jgi:hypothetical protein
MTKQAAHISHDRCSRNQLCAPSHPPQKEKQAGDSNDEEEHAT